MFFPLQMIICVYVLMYSDFFSLSACWGLWKPVSACPPGFLPKTSEKFHLFPQQESDTYLNFPSFFKPTSMNRLMTINIVRWRTITSGVSICLTFSSFSLSQFLLCSLWLAAYPSVHNHTHAGTHIQCSTRLTIYKLGFPPPIAPILLHPRVSEEWRLQWLTYSTTHLKCS